MDAASFGSLRFLEEDEAERLLLEFTSEGLLELAMGAHCDEAGDEFTADLLELAVDPRAT